MSKPYIPLEPLVSTGVIALGVRGGVVVAHPRQPLRPRPRRLRRLLRHADHGHTSLRGADARLGAPVEGGRLAPPRHRVVDLPPTLGVSVVAEDAGLPVDGDEGPPLPGVVVEDGAEVLVVSETRPGVGSPGQSFLVVRDCHLERISCPGADSFASKSPPRPSIHRLRRKVRFGFN